MLLNAAECQGYSFYPFSGLLRENQLPPKIRVKFIKPRKISTHPIFWRYDCLHKVKSIFGIFLVDYIISFTSSEKQGICKKYIWKYTLFRIVVIFLVYISGICFSRLLRVHGIIKVCQRLHTSLLYINLKCNRNTLQLLLGYEIHFLK